MYSTQLIRVLPPKHEDSGDFLKSYLVVYGRTRSFRSKTFFFYSWNTRV